jgi:hypothetical protein
MRRGKLGWLQVTLFGSLILGTPPSPAQVGGPPPLPPGAPTRSAVSNLLLDEINDDSLVARLDVSWEEEQLCVRVGIRPAPRALAVGNFGFVRYLDVDGTSKSIALRLKFPRKPEAVEEGEVPAWRACAETQGRLTGAERDEIQVTVREASRGAVRPTERYFLPFPTDNTKAHLILRRDPQGQLYPTDS